MKQRIRNTVCKLVLFMFYGTILLSSCFGGVWSVQDSASEVIEIRIDPSSAPGDMHTNLFDSIVYVPLETHKQSEFSSITQLEVTENYYIVLDGRLKTLFFFNHDGQFSHKIDKNDEKKGFGNIRGFALDRSKDILSFRDYNSPFTYTYRLNGELVEKADIEREKNIYRDFTLFNEFKLYYRPTDSDRGEGPDQGAFFNVITRHNAETDAFLGSYIPMDTVRQNVSLGVLRHFYNSGGNRQFFSHPYDYTLYELDSLAIPHARYKLILPLTNTLPEDFLTHPSYYGKWADYLRANRSLIYSIRDVYVSGDWLTFYTSPSIKRSAFLYNLATSDLFNLRETEDPLGLPVIGWGPVLSVNSDGALVSELPFLSLKKLDEELSKAERAELFPTQLLKLMKEETHNPILRLSYLKSDY